MVGLSGIELLMARRVCEPAPQPRPRQDQRPGDDQSTTSRCRHKSPGVERGPARRKTLTTTMEGDVGHDESKGERLIARDMRRSQLRQVGASSRSHICGNWCSEDV